MSMFENLLISLGLKEKNTTASSAKERLQVVVSHQRRHRHSPDYLPMLEKDILAVISKYVDIGEDKVDIKFQKGDKLSTLEVNVELPSEAAMKVKVKKIEEPADDLIKPSEEKKAKKEKEAVSA